jgi:hypothetical protein
MRPGQIELGGCRPEEAPLAGDIGGDEFLVFLQFVRVAGQCVERIGPLSLPQPRQEIAAIPDQ